MQHTLAMSSTEHNLWTIANILGLVVVVSAANTADTVLIPQVAGGVEAVLAEGLQHHLFLGRVLGKVKS